MGTTYEMCGDKKVLRMVNTARDKWHPKLDHFEVSIDVLWVRGELMKPALKLHGVPAIAVVKITNLKDRAKGLSDVEITLDERVFTSYEPATQMAIIDHELEHLELVFKEGSLERDDINRPKIRLRVHDHELGWFRNVAERHGENSIEVIQAKRLMDIDRQLFFAWDTQEAAA